MRQTSKIGGTPIRQARVSTAKLTLNATLSVTLSHALHVFYPTILNLNAMRKRIHSALFFENNMFFFLLSFFLGVRPVMPVVLLFVLL